MTDAELIRLAVEASGLSARVFAEEIVWRDERTVRLWRSGTQRMPPLVRQKLEWFLRLDVQQRRRYVDAATANA